MVSTHRPFFGDAFLRSVWDQEYEAFKSSGGETQLIERLEKWADRKGLKETSAEEAFMNIFFRDTWGYLSDGEGDAKVGFSMHPQFSIEGAGQTGQTGSADLALGWFSREGVPETPQVLCEFKDIKSGLDAPQKRKGNTRSPIEQCKDYLWGARKGLFGNESIVPTWGIVTDMNEFRLYWWDRMPHQYMRFTISRSDLFSGISLLTKSEEASFQRFLFYKVFHSQTLITTGGKSPLVKLLSRQWVREREIEKEFYKEYRTFRDRLYKNLVKWNPDFPGTKGRLVRLAQKILDRCIFVFYCEDMGKALDFPPNLLTDLLKAESLSEFHDPTGFDIWVKVKKLFSVMNEGGIFPTNNKISKFNGGLFADDSDLENLRITNDIFCERAQGTNEASLQGNTDTLLYLAGFYNYADKGSADKTLGLYTLGRIFEQSITELEILEAEAEGRVSINKTSKRKTNGVYYTPESIVEKIVEETLGRRFLELRKECGWPKNKEPKLEAVETYWQRIRTLKIVDPACGSGAFLITALHYLRSEYIATQELRKKLDSKARLREEGVVIEEILSNNLYGVDISPSSVEISKLALWLHTARADAPLSALDSHIVEGNSLVDSSFYTKTDLLEFDDEKRELINAFDWWKKFPEVAEQGGFDIVVGNPPYVKLQNFVKAYPEVDEFLRNGRPGATNYESTQTGNYDLYLPFIEKGIQLLNDAGRMGYIAPSLWVQNEYGKALRIQIHVGKYLDRWVDFKSHQVFDEAITYTALQFFTKDKNSKVAIHQAPDGNISAIEWDTPGNQLPYVKIDAKGEAWHLLPEAEKDLIDRLAKTCKRLDDPKLTSSVFQGHVTSMDVVYHLEKLGNGKYLHIPRGKNAPPSYEVEIEDAVMKPLVSGPETKRYLEPSTNTYLLFPYDPTQQGSAPIPENKFKSNFPKAWKYLKSCEFELRGREKGKMDLDEKWWGYVYPKNLNLHEYKKLVVAQTVPNLRVCMDSSASKYLNNVRVNGILASNENDLTFLLGCLNGPVADYIFRRIAAPKAGGYFEANKQFIAPLPIPQCGPELEVAIAAKAEALQKATTQRAEVLDMLQHRLGSEIPVVRAEDWLLTDVSSLDDWIKKAADDLTVTEKKRWAKTERANALDAALDEIQRHMRPGVEMSAHFDDGELAFKVDGYTIVDNVYEDEDDGALIHSQWDVVARTFNITDKTKAKTLVKALYELIPGDTPALVKQILKLRGDLETLDDQITQDEIEINELLFKAYNLTGEEIELVKKG